MTDHPDMPIAPAATVVLLRPASDGFEVLLMQRANELSFHGGAWVFPGGRIDPGDEVAGDELASARNAGVRETMEEAGIALNPESLRAFSHWTTPEGRSRRFATWFFAGEVGRQAQAVVDGSEMRDYRWLRPSDALLAHANKQLELPPPTFVSLTVLSRFTELEHAHAWLGTSEPFRFVPRPRKVSAGFLSLYAGDAAYEQGDVELPGPRHRLSMLDTGWRYEHSL